MQPSRRFVGSAIAMWLCLAAVPGSPARAQQYDASLRSLDYAPDPIARSPRLLGMGRLSLADDLHNRLSLWDFAGNPLGVSAAESTSSIEVRPSTRSSAGTHDIEGADPVRERQDLAARQVRNSIEAWRRARAGTSYGVAAELATLQLDRPFDESVEARAKFSVPAFSATINGPLAWIPGDRFGYAVRVLYTLEIHDDAYYQFFHVAQGDYIGRHTEVADGPDLFTPNHFETSTLDAGVGVSYRATDGITAAANVDHARAKIESRNRGLRSESSVAEQRPYDIGQFSLIGRLGRSLQWAADGRGWKSGSEETFLWSISAGPTRPPLAGGGKRLDRQEEGTALRTRARWTSGPLELGAAFNTSYSRVVIVPWYPANPSDPRGFNNFLDEVGFRAGTDTLRLPERVHYSVVEHRGREVSGGGTWRLAGGRATLGAEAHHWRDVAGLQLEGTPAVAGSASSIEFRIGPESRGWNVRAGGEAKAGGSVMIRAGYGYASVDQDITQSDDEYVITTATAGLGVRPLGSRWTVDIGYAFDWINADFGSPTRPRTSRQQIAAQLRWPL